MTFKSLGGLLLVAACIAGAAQAAQLPDSTYDIHVARPAFTTRHPVLLIDEAHHNFNTSHGLYRVFVKLAEADGFRVVANAKKFSASTLAGNDVLVIANAMGAAGLIDPNVQKPAFTASESDAVRNWVQAGGSLLLVADHTPMGAAASDLARRFGVDMSNGYLADGSMADRKRGASTLLFTRDNAGIGDHPITRGHGDGERVSKVESFTGQSLAGPPESVKLLRVSDGAEDLMIKRNEFAGTIPAENRKPAKGRAQALAVGFGKGRVVVVGDAAMLTALLVGSAGTGYTKTGMNVPGIDNQQFTLNVLNWLAKELN